MRARHRMLGIAAVVAAAAAGLTGAIVLADTAYGGIKAQRKYRAFVERHRAIRIVLGM